MQRTTLAVLLTCYNRKQKTLACLSSLFQQIMPPQLDLSVYLVDDGSTDGTAAAVGQAYPEVKILDGDGSLFWGGGMRMAFAAAMTADPDYYLWLNDDTMLDPYALRELMATSQRLMEQGEKPAIVAASTRDPETGELTYGGVVKTRWWRPLYLEKLTPTDQPQRCDSICGNCVLIPREVVKRVGNIDVAFTHYAGDWDYGLRAKQQGCGVWISAGYLATCPSNPKPAPRTQTQLVQEINKVDQPKGLALEDATLQPIAEWKVLAQHHAGIFWPIYWISPYRRLLWVSLLKVFKGKGV